MVMKLPGTPTRMKRTHAATANWSRASGYSASSDVLGWLAADAFADALLFQEPFHQPSGSSVASMGENLSRNRCLQFKPTCRINQPADPSRYAPVAGTRRLSFQCNVTIPKYVNPIHDSKHFQWQLEPTVIQLHSRRILSRVQTSAKLQMNDAVFKLDWQIWFESVSGARRKMKAAGWVCLLPKRLPTWYQLGAGIPESGIRTMESGTTCTNILCCCWLHSSIELFAAIELFYNMSSPYT